MLQTPCGDVTFEVLRGGMSGEPIALWETPAGGGRVLPAAAGEQFTVRLHHRGARAWQAVLEIDGVNPEGRKNFVSLFPAGHSRYRPVHHYRGWKSVVHGEVRYEAFIFANNVATVEGGDLAAWRETHGTTVGSIRLACSPAVCTRYQQDKRKKNRTSRPGECQIPEKLCFKEGRSIECGVGQDIAVRRSAIQFKKKGKPTTKRDSGSPAEVLRVDYRDRDWLDREWERHRQRGMGVGEEPARPASSRAAAAAGAIPALCPSHSTEGTGHVKAEGHDDKARPRQGAAHRASSSAGSNGGGDNEPWWLSVVVEDQPAAPVDVIVLD
jgi:hypothetical protein